MISLFNNNYYTDEAKAISKEICEALEPIYKKYKDTYSLREL